MVCPSSRGSPYRDGKGWAVHGGGAGTWVWIVAGRWQVPAESPERGHGFAVRCWGRPLREEQGAVGEGTAVKKLLDRGTPRG